MAIDGLRAAERRHAGGQDEVLDADRNPVETALWRTLGPAPLRRSGSVERPLGIDMTEGVERAVVGGDAVEHRRGHLDWRKAALLIALQQLDRREPSEIFRHRC